jgi:hypothetical protein
MVEKDGTFSTLMVEIDGRFTQIDTFFNTAIYMKRPSIEPFDINTPF